jgi:uncharacterized protein (TIGR02452 family)
MSRLLYQKIKNENQQIIDQEPEKINPGNVHDITNPPKSKVNKFNKSGKIVFFNGLSHDPAIHIMKIIKMLEIELDKINVTIHNFASGSKPGGGYINGSTAQEEDLCRVIPYLHPSLIKSMYGEIPFVDIQSYDDIGQKYIKHLFKDKYLIFSEKIEIMRNAHRNYEFIDPISINVVSSAAPVFNQYNNYNYKPEDIRKIFTSTFTIPAIEYDQNIIILGAWGCGAFRNDPDVISDIMINVITQYKKLYDIIIIAVPNNSYINSSESNYNVFKKNFKNITSITI